MGLRFWIRWKSHRLILRLLVLKSLSSWTFYLGSINCTIETKTGEFIAEDGCNTRSLEPLEWCGLFARSTLELKTITMRILGLCCFTSSCERNFSTFAHVCYNQGGSAEFIKATEDGMLFELPSIGDQFSWISKRVMLKIMPC